MKINLFNFENKQLRSGISVNTEIPIRKNNSYGVIVCPILPKDCRLKKIHSIKKLRKKVIREPSNKTCMTFITTDGKKEVIVM